MKKTLALALAVSLCLSAVACGDPPPSAAPSLSGPAASAAPAVPVTLRVVTTYSGDDGNGPNFQEGVRAWEAATGNRVDDGSATSDEAFKESVLGSFEAGTEPDVLFYFNGAESNPFVREGRVVSVEDIRKEYPDYAGNMKNGMLGASPLDGKNYSVPVNGIWEALYVNKAVLADCGIPVPGPDYRWDQFLRDCEVIKAKGYSPIAVSLAKIPHYWFEFVLYNQQTPATHNILPKAVDDDHGKAWVAGLNDLKGLYEKGYLPSDTLTATDDDTVHMFMDDKAAFLIDGNWKVGYIESYFTAKAGGTPDPEKMKNFTVSYVPGKNDRKATDIIGGLTAGYYITRKAWDDPAKRAAAVDFVSYLTSDAMVSKFGATSATALKNGIIVDESQLSSLARDGIAMVRGATGMAGAVQDQLKAPCRVPLFEGMGGIVTGEVSPEDAVTQCLRLVAENAS